MWEDPANKQGGRWLVSLEKKQRGPELNNCWLEVVNILLNCDIKDYLLKYDRLQ
jgi:translation initiation factor 4E